MEETLLCPSCGGPNDPVPGASRMPCAYCGANLTIPKKLQKTAKPAAAKKTSTVKPLPSLEKDAPDLLRKAQPVVVKAWNTYVYWTWFRRLLPGCLIVLLIGLFACLALGALPIVFGLLG
ncbi:MAG: hypothetical protein IPG44_13360 [Anaerolineales bacterium]|jgi:hypothetical protein|nr:hypothetical protein [Chloroflexota bacterium]MBK6646708.1 hypothetical protein [Anaerolineales bacterium]MCC6985200.1 hypothetical protein [Anaerolineales bacterium]